jgi:hypothetical protein
MTSLYQKLVSADQVCNDCGTKYGKYSVGCSSVWEGTCDVCGETKGVTEVRDYGYLTKGINELKPRRPAEPFSNPTKDFTPERKAKIKEQSKEVASYIMKTGLIASYEQGELTLKLTKDEVGFLNQCLDTIQENHPTLCPGHTDEDFDDVPLFESVERKICDLYADECVTYELSPALKAYYEKYGEYGTGVYALRWEGFRDAFNAGFTSS